MGVRIRQMRKEDLQQLAEIYSLVYKKIDVGERWSVGAAKKLLSYWLDRQPDLALVAECNGNIAGAIALGIKPWWDGNHLSDGEIFVHPACQNKGMGKLLLKAALEKAAKKYDATFLEAITFRNREFPLSWYRRLGLGEVKEWTVIGGDVRKVLRRLKK